MSYNKVYKSRLVGCVVSTKVITMEYAYDLVTRAKKFNNKGNRVAAMEVYALAKFSPSPVTLEEINAMNMINACYNQIFS